jgi:hypothetical protein
MGKYKKSKQIIKCITDKNEKKGRRRSNIKKLTPTGEKK